jgi:hypothetical protein
VIRVALALARLALRRSLGWPLLLGVVIVFTMAILPGASMPEAVTGDTASLGRMLARSRLWMLTGLIVTLLCIPRAASAANAARSLEGDLFSASALPRSIDVLATWCGVASAGMILLVLGAISAELAAGGSGEALSPAANFENPSIRLVERSGARWEIPLDEGLLEQAQDPRARLLVDVVALPWEARSTSFSAHVDADESSGETVRVLLDGRARLSLPLGRGKTRTLEIGRADEGAVAIVPASSIALHLAAPLGERSASLRLFASGALSLLAACALALGLGTWMQAWIASLGVLSLGLTPALLGLHGLPGARIGSLLTGDVPPAMTFPEAAVLLGAILLGLGLAAAARGRRRES